MAGIPVKQASAAKGLHTGVCPKCRLRWVAVRVVKRDPTTGFAQVFFVVRAHGCGRGLKAQDVQPLPVITTPAKETA